jgi:Ca-activated chloride channel family protein
MSDNTCLAGLVGVFLNHAWRVTARLTARLFTVLIVLLSFEHGFGQEAHIVPGDRYSLEKNNFINRADEGKFKVNADLVLVPITVTDALGRLVIGLGAQDFKVFEGKERQPIKHCSSEDSPISLGIILDTSGSMRNKIEYAREAVMEFLKTANPQDEVFLITFSEKPEVVTDFTTSIENIQNDLVYAAPKGTTALLDAIYLGIKKMRQAQFARKALLVISDGGDNHSRYTLGEIRRTMREADTLIYSIGIYDREFASYEELVGPILLDTISTETGGEMFTINNPKDFANIAARIGIELRHQYLLAYRPLNPKYDGKWHKIKVKVTPQRRLARLDVHAKRGYYAPAE